MKENLLEQYGYTENEGNSALTELPERQLHLEPARIIAQHKNYYQAATAHGEIISHLSGKYLFANGAAGGFPVVGDYVRVKVSEEKDRAVIHELMPRKTMFYRRNNFDKSELQVLAANFDTIFICMALNRDFNLTRLERYVIMARESGADIAVVLTKADLCDDPGSQAVICEAVCPGIPVYTVSAQEKIGMEQLHPYFGKGKTVIALGSSGVGKSSLVNALFGEAVMETSEVRASDDRGRHTTVHRQMIVLPGGGLYLDTPGLREVGIADAAESVSEQFADLEELQLQCKFKDCRHEQETGCAVKRALEEGRLTPDRLAKYRKLLKESAFDKVKSRYLYEKWQASKAFSKQLKKQKKGRKEKF
ncbi:ribosome small subunit-dependent GTPase A [Paenibacillus sp. NPDC058174]|uniref:ribosome small subunit-dependent GTPase A n=1 Tax=Paenibacillus sp. NPDC058174 TaxID=3346366 RepID=UPI0036D8B01E